jgi:hypothetical protein
MKVVDLDSQTVGQHVKDSARQMHKKETVKLLEKAMDVTLQVNTIVLHQVNITVIVQEKQIVGAMVKQAVQSQVSFLVAQWKNWAVPI